MAEDDLVKSAQERRERLRALRAAVELVGSQTHERDNQDPDDQEAEEEADAEDEQQAQRQEVIFRNYIPRSKDLQPSKVIPPTIPKFEDPVAPAPISNGAEDPFVSIAPKKANWDLKRDVAKKLEKLEKRTQRALIELMYEEERQRQELAESEEQIAEE